MARNSFVDREDKLHPAWAVAILLWMSFGLGVYAFNLLTVPGRIDRIVALLRSLLN